jgi:pyruvate dehydrogenase E1 component
VIDGGYWLRQPGPNCEVVIAYQGVIAPEAIKAAGGSAKAGAISACWRSRRPTD